MGTNTKIEWTQATWNPVRGCSIVSEGCRNCYAMRMAHRSNRPGGAYEGLTRVGAHGPTWTGDVRFVPEMLDYPLRLRKPHRFFVNSMSDLFHDSVTDQQLTDIFGIMALAHRHTFQILTKRPERMQSYLAKGDHGIIAQFDAIQRGGGIGPRWMFRELDIKRRDGVGWQWPLPNVWLGVSCEDQKTFDERWPFLRDTPAHTRWLSLEPLLGPIDTTAALVENHYNCDEGTDEDPTPAHRCHPIANWIVVGGESGAGARPMHPDWVRSLRDQCKVAHVPFFFKQWGAWVPDALFENVRRRGLILKPDGSTPTESDMDALMSGDSEFYNHQHMTLVGKKAAGNLLDGREHLEYPA